MLCGAAGGALGADDALVAGTPPKPTGAVKLSNGRSAACVSMRESMLGVAALGGELFGVAAPSAPAFNGGVAGKTVAPAPRYGVAGLPATLPPGDAAEVAGVRGSGTPCHGSLPPKPPLAAAAGWPATGAGGVDAAELFQSFMAAADEAIGCGADCCKGEPGTPLLPSVGWANGAPVGKPLTEALFHSLAAVGEDDAIDGSTPLREEFVAGGVG